MRNESGESLGMDHTRSRVSTSSHSPQIKSVRASWFMLESKWKFLQKEQTKLSEINGKWDEINPKENSIVEVGGNHGRDYGRGHSRSHARGRAVDQDTLRWHRRHCKCGHKTHKRSLERLAHSLFVDLDGIDWLMTTYTLVQWQTRWPRQFRDREE